MQPFPSHRRRAYLFAFMAAFVVLLPLVIMYADGWRWKSGFGFVRTGAVYINVPYADVTVSFDGQEYGRSGFLQRSFYIDDLAPSVYVVGVAREGYLPWSRILAVEPQLVTDAQVLLIPKRIEPVRLALPGAATSGAVAITRAQYDAYMAAFEPIASTTPLLQDESDSVGLFVEEGDVYARWMSENAFPPSRFCGRPTFCTREIIIDKGAEEVRTARFFNGGAAYATREGGVYFSEIDARPTPLSVKLFEAPEADIRIVDDAIIVRSEDTLYRITL